jgi:squalene-hopene/tetraprenyl-beta-curcumene cyclase
MKRLPLYLCLVLLILFAGALFWTARKVDASSTPSRGALRPEWSPAAAASYLDYREAWWQSWPRAQKDHGTVCISCHTVVPYAFVRSALSAQLSENGLTPAEHRLLDSIETRVTKWPQTTSYYTDTAHAAPSRATESVLNALILSSYARRSGQFDPITRSAFAEAWALQIVTGNDAGGWAWQNFHEAPWESSESAYWGAALMSIAVDGTPEAYQDDPGVRLHVTALQDYLRRTYSQQPPINQVYVIWADAELPGLVSNRQLSQFITKVESLQQPDGGWSLASLDNRESLQSRVLDAFRRIDRVDGSDGCGTGLAILGLEKAGVPLQDPAVQRGLEWLRQHQYQDGSWWAPSLNGLRKPDSELGRFLSDAATGYAVLAIEQARSEQPASAEDGRRGPRLIKEISSVDGQLERYGR